MPRAETQLGWPDELSTVSSISASRAGWPFTNAANLFSLNQKHLPQSSAAIRLWHAIVGSQNKRVMANENHTRRITGTQLLASPQINHYMHENKIRIYIPGSFGKIAMGRNLNLPGSFGRILLSANLNRAPALATLSLYVSHLRRPASPPSSSGDQCAAGPGLNRFSKSNERTPAAAPAGFFIASGPSCRQRKALNQK
jgi:hypothetical protein